MTRDLARADRAAAVRDGARAWKRAGAIDDAALAAVNARYPDDRVRTGPVFRLLLFAFTCFAVSAVHGILWFFVRGAGGDAQAAVELCLGLGMAAATDYQIGTLRRRQGGTEAASSWMALVFLTIALVRLVTSHFGPALGWTGGTAICCLVIATLFGAAAWRWGYSFYAGVAAAALLAAAAQLSWGRLLWIALPLAAASPLLRASASPRLPPAHRAAATAVLVVALAALYAAVHLGSWEWQLIEEIGGRHGTVPRGDVLWWAAAAATALVPAALLAWSLPRRRYPLLLLGAATGLVSLVTLRHYVHLAPPWLAMTAGGALLVGLVLALERYLRSGPGGERHGYTAAPLFANAARARLLEAAAAMLTLTPASRSLDDKPAYEGGGGRSGGGGASGEF